MRQKRRALSRIQQRRAAQALCRQLSLNPLYRRAKDIAFYFCNDGEIDPAPLLRHALRQQKRCYLPVLAPGNKLWFARYRRGQALRKNGFGIPEPRPPQQRINPMALYLVLMPLVAFDKHGGRLGMGGGFYDRSFAWAKRWPQMPQPTLVGLAHSFQEVERLNTEPWDIPLAGVATDKGVLLHR